MAAEKGVAGSQVALAHSLLSSKDGARDVEAARTWLEKAAAAGASEAEARSPRFT